MTAAHEVLDPVCGMTIDAESAAGSWEYKGRRYYFCHPSCEERFKADPEKYLPRYGGYCAYAMAINRIADIDPSRWAIVDGKLYLNNNFLSYHLWSLHKSGNIAAADRNLLPLDQILLAFRAGNLVDVGKHPFQRFVFN